MGILAIYHIQVSFLFNSNLFCISCLFVYFTVYIIILGLINLGQFEPFSYEFSELPIFLLMGSAGGLLGALWNYCNTRLTEFRKR